MSNGERNINDGNNNQYTLSRPVAGPQTCASGISWFEDERSSSSSNVSSPTTVIRHNSSDNPYQHNLRCHSQSLPIRKASVKSWKSLEAEAPGRLIPSENDRHVDNIQNLAQYHQDETTFSGQQDIMQQDNESSMLSDMVSEAQTWISEDSENKTKSSKNSDNTPYIRFAIEQLTRAEDLQIESLQLSYLDPVSNFRPMKPSFPESNQANTSPTRERINLSPSSSPETYLDYKIISNQGHPYLTPEREREGMALTRKYRSPPSPGPSLSLYPTSHLESISNDFATAFLSNTFLKA
ncbi:hypothetical protein EV44_g2811 [Erysiphe necator]|uniref:Uncharacterized protein n=1 Tax=Uncinula necator TaxID=52586 RepID=A0A0B1PEE9_UNCNE|nr:hypothetical protein EV44_g2811 [Erysiphe necator]